MTDYTTRSAPEAKAKALIDQMRKGDTWSPERQVIALVFDACWSSALPLDRVVKIGWALSGFAEVTLTSAKFRDALQTELTRLTKAKVLRSWTRGNTRYYELNLGE